MKIDTSDIYKNYIGLQDLNYSDDLVKVLEDDIVVDDDNGSYLISRSIKKVFIVKD